MKHFADNADYYAALKRITLYDSVARLRRDSERRYGLTYEEALEYAYENVKAEAERAIRGRRAPKPPSADAEPESKKPHAGGNAGSDSMAAKCIACGEEFHLCDQEAHLRTKHATPIGGFRFWMDAKAFFADKPSMLVADLRKHTGSTVMGHVVQEINNEHIFYSDGQAVDLTKEPHFFILLPATY